MNKPEKNEASRSRSLAMAAGLIICLATMGFGYFASQKDTGAGGAQPLTVDQMRQLAHQISDSAWQSTQGAEATFNKLQEQLANFDRLLSEIPSAELPEQLSVVDVSWQPVKRAGQKLVNAGPLIVYVHSVAEQFSKSLEPLQLELAAVVESLSQRNASSQTIIAAQSTLWLSESIARNIDSLLLGGADIQALADEIRADSAEFIRIVEALTRGNAGSGINKVTGADAMGSLTDAFSKFSIVTTSVDRISSEAPELAEAVSARDRIVAASAPLGASLASLSAAIDQQAGLSPGVSGTLMTLMIVPGVLAIALLLGLYVDQRRREIHIRRGVAQVDAALQKLATGDLTAKVAAHNATVMEVARGFNTAADQQRELIQAIRTPFEQSVQQIGKIGISARGQVEKCKELAHSVEESMTAATEMVRTSEEIKTSTAEASVTSERNCQQVAQGYELTKDMSKASADVRESVQETSKSAKRQSELIQSVTAAAEYIQALNTKISVVAINTRIEAEKAGEYGRPFLGIAEAIADLLREAQEEGRKIISDVRMLQNMSAENLASMENTVGTVVTILQYIERLDSSLEEINSGSSAISSIVGSVDEAAGQSAVSALHMNNSMAEIRERSQHISKFSEATQQGVNNLKRSMKEASENLAQFSVGASDETAESEVSELDELETIGAAKTVYLEEDMSALETAEQATASV